VGGAILSLFNQARVVGTRWRVHIAKKNRSKAPPSPCQTVTRVFGPSRPSFRIQHLNRAPPHLSIQDDRVYSTADPSTKAKIRPQSPRRASRSCLLECPPSPSVSPNLGQGPAQSLDNISKTCAKQVEKVGGPLRMFSPSTSLACPSPNRPRSYLAVFGLCKLNNRVGASPHPILRWGPEPNGGKTSCVFRKSR